MHMRPFQIITISVFAVLAVVGVFFFATFKGFGTGNPAGVVTIWGTLPQVAVQAGIDDLKRTHTEFDKVTYVERSPATFDADLANALASGNGPDLVIISQEELLTNEGKLSIIPFSTLPERTYRDTFLPISQIFLTTQGTYGVPLAIDPLVLYYNRTLLSGAGVASPPTSWEAIVGLASTLTKKSDTGVIQKATIPLGAYDNIENARGILSLLLLQSGTPISSNRNEQGLRSALMYADNSTTGAIPGVSAVSFYTQFADPAKLVYTWNRSITDARQSFLAGDSVFYIGYASEQSQLAGSNPNLSFDMASIPQPQTASTPTDYGLAYAFAVPKASKNASGAYRTATALANSTESPIIAHALGMAPALRSLLKPSTNDLYAPIYYPLALVSQAWLSPSPQTTDTIFAGMINSVVSGRQSVRDALLAADQALTAAL